MDAIYAIEPVMHKGVHYEPGELIKDADENDVGAIMSAGRGTQDEKTAAAARAQFKATQAAAAKAAADAEKKAVAPLSNAITEAIAQALKG